jgi:hypothetical protein
LKIGSRATREAERRLREVDRFFDEFGDGNQFYQAMLCPPRDADVFDPERSSFDAVMRPAVNKMREARWPDKDVKLILAEIARQIRERAANVNAWADEIMHIVNFGN